MYLGARLPKGIYSVFEFHQHYFKIDILTWEFSNKKKIKTIQFWSQESDQYYVSFVFLSQRFQSSHKEIFPLIKCCVIRLAWKPSKLGC